MKDLRERFKRWWNAPSTDPFDVLDAMREAREKELCVARVKQARAKLRDRFAEKAMEKIIEAADLSPAIYHDENNTKALAKLSYGIADAMMKARGDGENAQ